MSRHFIKIDKCHHAFLIESRKEEQSSIKKFIEQSFDIKFQGSSDSFFIAYDSLGIDECRAIINMASRASFSKVRIIAIFAKAITKEAQNSLLKLFEEPSENTKFLLIVPNADAVIDTLKSRVSIVSVDWASKVDAGIKLMAKDFIAANLKKRLSSIKKIVEDKDKDTALKLLDELEIILAKHIIKEDMGRQVASFLSKSLQRKRQLAFSGSSLKLILESTALLTPTIKF